MKQKKGLRCYLKNVPLLDIVNELYYEMGTDFISTRDMRIIISVYEDKEKLGCLTRQDMFAFLNAVFFYDRNRRSPIINNDVFLDFLGKVYEKEGSLDSIFMEEL